MVARLVGPKMAASFRLVMMRVFDGTGIVLSWGMLLRSMEREGECLRFVGEDEGEEAWGDIGGVWREVTAAIAAGRCGECSNVGRALGVVMSVGSKWMTKS